MSLEHIFTLIQHESRLFGGESNAHIVGLLAILATLLYYFGYFVAAKLLRKKTIIRNPELERDGYEKKAITTEQLMIKYSGNLSASSTMAALSVAMVVLSVAALFQATLKPYDNFVVTVVCSLMTIASVGLLFAHELYDAILNPLFDPKRRFRLRKLGADFQAMGLILFIVSMLLAISTVSTVGTIFASAACCAIMTAYIEMRLVDAKTKGRQMRQLVASQQSANRHE
jgi:hypothetical protein